MRAAMLTHFWLFASEARQLHPGTAAASTDRMRCLARSNV